MSEPALGTPLQSPPHPRQRRVRIVLAIALVGLAIHLIFGRNPWHDGIAEALREGKPVLPRDIADTWLWWTAAANAVVVAALLATLPRWLRPAPVSEVRSLAPPRRGRIFTALVVATVLVGGFLVQTRLSFSWWDDEGYSVRRYIDGEWAGLGTDHLHFRTVHWRDTLWRNTEGNNHVAFSVLSRLSLAVWRALARPHLPLASEVAARMPSYLAGIGAIAATALLGWRLGFAAAGVSAGWLLLLHPWFIRYASEARGYGMVLLLVPTLWILLLRVLQRGTWGRWIAYGAVQALLLATHMGMVLVVLTTNAAAVVGLAVFHRGRPALREQGTRFLVTSLLSAAVWAQLMVPNFVQMLDYLADWRGRAGVPPLEQELGFVLAGVQLHTADPRYVTLAQVAARWPGLLRAVAGIGVLAATAGAVRLAVSGAAGRLILPSILLPGPLMYTLAMVRRERFYEYYLVFVLPGLVLLVCAGLTWPFARIRAPLRAPLAAATLAAFVAAFAVVTQAPRASLRAGSLVTTRESVLVTRPSLDPFSAENRRILTASFSWPPIYYDPRVHWVTTLKKLRALMAEADARGVPLFINNGRPHDALHQHPDLVAFVEKSGRFEKVADLPGFEKRGHRIVYRYLGLAPPAGSAAGDGAAAGGTVR